MKITATLLICLTAIATAGMLYRTLSSSTGRPSFSVKLQETFAKWKLTHRKMYLTPSENDFRLSIFAKELQFIEVENRKYEEAIAARGETLSGPMFEMNFLGDLTPEEFTASYNGLLPMDSEFIEQEENKEEVLLAREATVIPTGTERSSLGQSAFVPKIKDQGSCGSCWAYSAVVELERKYVVAGNQYTELSVQELVDCERRCMGCQGGHPEHVYDYVNVVGLFVKVRAR